MTHTTWLATRVAEGRFREDLLARINLWTFHLPGLRERPEDLEPNLDFELERVGDALKLRLTMNREARERYLGFARSQAAAWNGNFRDFGASVRRMATLCDGGRIGVAEVDEEIERLRALWRTAGPTPALTTPDLLERLLGRERVTALDRFDRAQLADVLDVCRGCRSPSEAGRMLFASRAARTSTNDADRLRKYRARHRPHAGRHPARLNLGRPPGPPHALRRDMRLVIAHTAPAPFSGARSPRGSGRGPSYGTTTTEPATVRDCTECGFPGIGSWKGSVTRTK